MNIPSHYQSAFFRALNARDEINLCVVYFDGASQERAEEGWNAGHETQPYESFAAATDSPEELVRSVPDWNERVHIIAGVFCPELVRWMCENSLRWCHWSEMPGIRLAAILGYRAALFRWLNPVMLFAKRGEGRWIRNCALGAFGQGALARRAFRMMGVSKSKIADLYYTPDGLEKTVPCAAVVSFAEGRKVFLAVGALCRRKGIDVLLRAFARLKAEGWCLVLCGLDRSGGGYEALAQELGIQHQVLFLGAYPSERIAEVYSASDVFVLPSRFDGWGAVLNEAASVKLALIGTDLCGGSWHVIQPALNGFRVRAGDVNTLSRAMHKYVDSPALIETHGAVSLRLFQQEFTPEKNVDRLVQALTQWEGAR
jgi:glycosyltransferase involved in cell wall biosynthesis